LANKQPSQPAGSRYARLANDSPRKDAASWEDADAQELWRTVCEATSAGDALMFGRTRDGGALVLTVLSGDERVRNYATGAEEVSALLARIREAVEADS